MEEKCAQPKIFGVRIDIVIVAALLVVALIWSGIALLTREPGAYIEVTEKGTLVGRYSLSVDAEYTLGGGTNTLVIEGGAAYMHSADCPDKTCVNVGRISFRGEKIVCLPNEIVVTVVGGDGVDLVS